MQRVYLTTDQIVKIYFLRKKGNKKPQEIAKELNVPVPQVHSALVKINKYWSPRKHLSHKNKTYVEAVDIIKYNTMHKKNPTETPFENLLPVVSKALGETYTATPSGVEESTRSTMEEDRFVRLEKKMTDLQEEIVDFITEEVEANIKLTLSVNETALQEAQNQVKQLTERNKALQDENLVLHEQKRELEEKLKNITPAQKRWIEKLKTMLP